jgi:hypothetical protein
MDDDDPQCIEMMLCWLYGNHYNPRKVLSGSKGGAGFNADMADLADKYDLPYLAISVWERTAHYIENDDWCSTVEKDVAAVFSSGRDNKSYRQAQDIIVEEFLEMHNLDISVGNVPDWTELFQDNPRFASRIALKLLPTNSKA